MNSSTNSTKNSRSNPKFHRKIRQKCFFVAQKKIRLEKNLFFFLVQKSQTWNHRFSSFSRSRFRSDRFISNLSHPKHSKCFRCRNVDFRRSRSGERPRSNGPVKTEKCRSLFNSVFSFSSRLNLDFQLIFEAFGKIHHALFIWLLMQLCTSVLVFMAFYSWSHNRLFYLDKTKKLSKNQVFQQRNLFSNFSCRTEIYDKTWLIIYMTYIILFLLLPCREIVKHQLPIASSLIVLLEQVRSNRKINHRPMISTFFLRFSASSINENLFVRPRKRRQSSQRNWTTEKFAKFERNNESRRNSTLSRFFSVSLLSLRSNVDLSRWLSAQRCYSMGFRSTNVRSSFGGDFLCLLRHRSILCSCFREFKSKSNNFADFHLRFVQFDHAGQHVPSFGFRSFRFFRTSKFFSDFLRFRFLRFSSLLVKRFRRNASICWSNVLQSSNWVLFLETNRELLSYLSTTKFFGQR